MTVDQSLQCSLDLKKPLEQRGAPDGKAGGSGPPLPKLTISIARRQCPLLAHAQCADECPLLEAMRALTNRWVIMAGKIPASDFAVFVDAVEQRRAMEEYGDTDWVIHAIN